MSEEIDQVILLDVGIKPDAGVSGPVLLQHDFAAFLTFNAVRLGEDGRFQAAGTAIAEIVGCRSTKFGSPNDEAIAGHPLYAKGLKVYDIFQVLDPSWVTEQTAQNRVSFPNTPDGRSNHYVFTFHDSTFECLADDLKIEVSEEPYEQIFQRLSQRFLDNF